MSQLELLTKVVEHTPSHLSYEERFRRLLSGNLDFHGQNSTYDAHAFHAFPAKFPPQLPRVFIQALTVPDDIVFDPMMGSATTLLEAILLGRRAVGTDIDPLALRIGWVKLNPPDFGDAHTMGIGVVKAANRALLKNENELRKELDERFDISSRSFINYWFAEQTQLELIALIREIERIDNAVVRAFLMLNMSAIIITKSGGVSLARDLAHTRPHREESKIPRPAVLEFHKRLKRNLQSLVSGRQRKQGFVLCEGNAENLPLMDNSIDLIVTSPPYASNAIDYMRAHKFTLVWLGHAIDELGELRRSYVGGESLSNIELLPLPNHTQHVVTLLTQIDVKKGRVLHRYYSEMTRVLGEMFRVLKPGKAAIVVVGTSIIRNTDIEIQACLAEIGESFGFELSHIGIRHLDRDKRMMPARKNTSANSQIEARMHEEYVIGFLKP